MNKNNTPTPKEPFQPVRTDVNFPSVERKILQFWKDQESFEQSIQIRENSPAFSFYDGPPFATGLPHYGHLLAGTLKDIVPRYWTMRGYRVDRRFGWDCHGLPVEYEINKTLNIQSNKDVLALGIDKYNAECRKIVNRYSNEWKSTVKRMGRWVDMDNAYFTMEPEFMESVWWVFQELFKKGLIYEGYKVVPYSTGLSTVLSNFEANQNYKEVQDPAIVVRFESQDETGLFFLAWTTTPWTLPSNMGLAIHQDYDYVEVKETKTGARYIAAEKLWRSAFGKNAEDHAIDTHFEILRSFKGRELIGKKYKPLFNFFEDKAHSGAFRLVHSDHVTLEMGVGAVHLAPAFGEDDYYVSQKNGIPFVNPVDDDGVFTSAVGKYAGRGVKDADKDLIAELKASGALVKHETLNHSYPFCWRTDKPLIYRAVSSWFVNVEVIKESLLKNNETTNWTPDHLRDGRFGKWLENARDWAVSRNRFWGTPIPIWRNTEGEVICIGSRKELEELSGQKVSDLHMESIDSITIPSPTGKSPLKRIAPVLDCWFESGSMPYAQWGYPNTHKEEFRANFPADFIAEGLDQTRGWFYTLMVIGTALFNKAPFKNVVVNGLILAEDGKKMSKRLKNYPDPNELLERHGADALRLYLIDSPVVKAQELRFSEKGVSDVVRKILLRWWNAYSFFVSYANVDHFQPRLSQESPLLLDQWIISRLNSLIRYTNVEMENYRLYNVVPKLLDFVEDLTNTYIRLNRTHFWQNGMPAEKVSAFETLYTVLIEFSKVMAPFTPFLSEEIYQNLSAPLNNGVTSVHHADFPKVDESKIKPDLEEAVIAMETLLTLGRNYREKIGIKAKIPLKTVRIVHRDAHLLKELKLFEPYFLGELNIEKALYENDEDAYVSVQVKANFPVLGKRVGPKMKEVAAALGKLELPKILKLEQGEELEVAGEKISLADIEIRRSPKPSHPNLQVSQKLSIDIDPSVSPEQIAVGLTREVTRKVQQARKNAKLSLGDRIELFLKTPDEMKTSVAPHASYIQGETLAVGLTWSPPQDASSYFHEISEDVEIWLKKAKSPA